MLLEALPVFMFVTFAVSTFLLVVLVILLPPKVLYHMRETRPLRFDEDLPGHEPNDAECPLIEVKFDHSFGYHVFLKAGVAGFAGHCR